MSSHRVAMDCARVRCEAATVHQRSATSAKSLLLILCTSERHAACGSCADKLLIASSKSGRISRASVVHMRRVAGSTMRASGGHARRERSARLRAARFRSTFQTPNMGAPSSSTIVLSPLEAVPILSSRASALRTPSALPAPTFEMRRPPARILALPASPDEQWFRVRVYAA
jgi:hypothetical protein